MIRALPEMRCCECGRLLFKIEDGGLTGTLSIKCPRCRTFNVLRPSSPSPKIAHERLSEGKSRETKS
jgi:phage FluMu protein Com